MCEVSDEEERERGLTSRMDKVSATALKRPPSVSWVWVVMRRRRWETLGMLLVI